MKNELFALNIKKSETARLNITRGLALGKNPFTILMIAVKCIADMSGDSTFYDVCCKSMQAVYGAGLEDKDYMKAKIIDLEENILKITENMSRSDNEDTRKRLQLALRLQKNELNLLRKKIEL
ncbi:MAG: hypothetical protein IJZ72_03295 [Oscillospiraceae bacterium]|nr:hypothetical protein [Oscillospiraceae bacterium]